jgi:FkbM family methyltransferase
MSTKLWAALATKAHYIADLGANTGLYSLAAGAINPTAQIVALEPNPEIFDKLRANLAINNFRVMPLAVAASDEDGTTSMHLYASSLHEWPDEPKSARRIAVRVTKLDTLIREIRFPRIDLLKIDVERNEPQTLRGMKDVLSRSRPSMIIEILDDQIGEAVERELAGLDYLYFAINEDGVLRQSADLRRRGREGRNFLICRQQIWTDIALQFKMGRSGL